MNISELNRKIKYELTKERPSQVDYKEYLRHIFKLYRDSVKQLSKQSISSELPRGTDFSKLNSEILKTTSALLRASNSYSDGKLSTAITIMRNRFLVNDSIQSLNLTSSQSWFRARISRHCSNGFQPNEMFHIPFEKRNDVVNYRFSISGYPCLYLGNSILSCWAEMHAPALDDFVVSRVEVNEGAKIKVLDLRIPNELQGGSEDNNLYKNLLLLKTWPLIIASSIKTITPSAPFKFEYIHPQLLMLALREQNNDIWGIAYTSTHINPDMTNDYSLYTNIAIPVRKADSSGLCKQLSNIFKITRGVPFIEAEIKSIFDIVERFRINDDGYLIVDSYRDGSAPYNQTKFGQFEVFLRNNVTSENI